MTTIKSKGISTNREYKATLKEVVVYLNKIAKTRTFTTHELKLRIACLVILLELEDEEKRGK